MTNSNLTGDQLLAWSKKITELANSLPKKDKFNDFRNDLTKNAEILQAKATNAFLNELKFPAEKLQGVTKKIQTAINNIKTADQGLELAASVVTAIGTLASAIQGGDSKGIGTAIDDLLKISGF